MSEPTTAPMAADVVALPDQFFRLKRYLIVLMVVGVGGWFCYDGFYNWPKQKREAEAALAAQQVPKEKPHSDADIRLQQILGLGLPPIGLLALAWFLYGSRGEYRLSGTTLHVPGHPAIPVDCITLIDKTRWERKGVAILSYELPGKAGAGRFRLDDFIYEREPTDLILQRLEAHLLPPQAPESTPDGDDQAVT